MDSLRVPMQRVAARLVPDHGAARDVTLFLAEGERVEEVFERASPFLPIRDGERVRLYARAAIACLAEDPARPSRHPGDELPMDVHPVVVWLRSGVVLRGELRHPRDERYRVLDLLNEGGASFTLHGVDQRYHVAKAHVLAVEEE